MDNTLARSPAADILLAVHNILPVVPVVAGFQAPPGPKKLLDLAGEAVHCSGKARRRRTRFEALHVRVKES